MEIRYRYADLLEPAVGEFFSRALPGVEPVGPVLFEVG